VLDNLCVGLKRREIAAAVTRTATAQRSVPENASQA
jgi:hypothetical protein